MQIPHITFSSLVHPRGWVELECLWVCSEITLWYTGRMELHVIIVKSSSLLSSNFAKKRLKESTGLLLEL